MGSEEHKLEAVAAKLGSSPADLGMYDGRGLQSLHGKLVFPVQGKIIQHFGRQKHEEFSDFLFVKGLEVLASVGGVVRSVAVGNVVFREELPGFGKVVILDHGQRYYTLYGRLGAFGCQVGDQLELGGIVGILGEPDSRGRNFYFELRFQGKAIDPLEFFTKPLPS